MGRKRDIDQSNCNKDYSCVEGFCPSFVTVHGGQLKKGKKANNADRLADLPMPTFASALDKPWNILITVNGYWDFKFRNVSVPANETSQGTELQKVNCTP